MICPNCQIDVAISEQLYGALYTCGSCQAVYFINFDGRPEFGEVPTDVLSDIVSEPSEASEPLSVAEPFTVPEQAVAQENNFESGFESSLEPLVDSVDMVNFDNKLDAQFDPYVNNEFQQTDSETKPEEPAPDYSSDLNPFEAMQSDSPAENINSFSRVAKEISEFGNSEAHMSGLHYDLQISGLDTQVTMKEFKEIIDDPRFGWDANELLRTVKSGKIKFEKLNPVKAFILAKRLQFLDIEKVWKQNAIS